MIIDGNARKKLGSSDESAIKYWNDAAPHLQARYCHASLGTKIKIEWFLNCPGLIGDLPVLFWSYGVAATQGWLQNLNNWGYTSYILEGCNNDADLLVYMADSINTGSNDANGYADVASVCTNDSGRKQAIVEWHSYPSRFGAVCSSTIYLYLLYCVSRSTIILKMFRYFGGDCHATNVKSVLKFWTWIT